MLALGITSEPFVFEKKGYGLIVVFIVLNNTTKGITMKLKLKFNG